jgi:hypothetical protein
MRAGRSTHRVALMRGDTRGCSANRACKALGRAQHKHVDGCACGLGERAARVAADNSNSVADGCNDVRAERGGVRGALLDGRREIACNSKH